MRAAVLQWTGIPVSVGIAPTKTLAKVANHMAKKDEKHGGVVVLLDEVAQDAALARLGLTDLWVLPAGWRRACKRSASRRRSISSAAIHG